MDVCCECVGHMGRCDTCVWCACMWYVGKCLFICGVWVKWEETCVVCMYGEGSRGWGVGEGVCGVRYTWCVWRHPHGLWAMSRYMCISVTLGGRVPARGGCMCVRYV